ncbi:MAG: NUDIX hydrolase [Bacilli bacterium]|nr:NUDIX hydrolase [Bacilli bacterium]
MYSTEEEFLKNYNPDEFEKLSMTTDIMILSVSDQEVSNYRKTSKKMMSILLVKRDDFPYKNKWCLPGGFLNPSTETLEECARRVLKRETNLSDIYMEQLYTFDRIDRDPRLRVVSCSYIALVDKKRLNQEVKNASWFDIIDIKEDKGIVRLTLSNGKEIIDFSVKKTLRKNSSDRYSFETDKNDSLAFDHDIVILAGLERIKNKINYTDIVFNMMGKYFTLGDLQRVYEVILNKKLLDPAFRRIIADKVEKTDKMRGGEGHRPSYLYKYKKSE